MCFMHNYYQLIIMSLVLFMPSVIRADTQDTRLQELQLTPKHRLTQGILEAGEEERVAEQEALNTAMTIRRLFYSDKVTKSRIDLIKIHLIAILFSRSFK